MTGKKDSNFFFLNNLSVFFLKTLRPWNPHAL